jgi:hypothetical protein
MLPNIDSHVNPSCLSVFFFCRALGFAFLACWDGDGIRIEIWEMDVQTGRSMGWIAGLGPAFKVQMGWDDGSIVGFLRSSLLSRLNEIVIMD